MLFTWTFMWGFLWGIPGVLVAVPLLTTLKIVAERVPRTRPLARAIGYGRAE